jgi:hypothetical protein
MFAELDESGQGGRSLARPPRRDRPRPPAGGRRGPFCGRGRVYSGAVARFRSVANATLTVACIGLAALSVRNVYGDSSGVEALARERASCPEAHCHLSRIERTPFGQSFEFRRQGAIVMVRCSRSALLVGPFECVNALP